jgi:6-pyruvoyltetrahydropterin/6-carboxytetrahydropterin synthase
MHGHNYVVYISARAESLDSIGRIIDFSVLKQKIGGWIDKNWDHTTILYSDDMDMIERLLPVQNNKPLYIAGFNPTAEEMADFLLHVVCPRELDGTGVEVFKITLYETENCYATSELSS